MSDAEILVGGRGVWSATPWLYSSMRFLKFEENGAGELIYGYGQTIYAVIKCTWEAWATGRLRLAYLESPPVQRFQGFRPGFENVGIELEYKLTEGEVVGVEDIVNQPYRFLWTLELSEPPWPSCLNLPHEPPRVFYGPRQ